MSNIKYTYIPLDKATIIDRRHQREVQPPGMVNLENFIPARSDESPTLRPDIVATQDEIYSISDVLSLPTGNTMRDLLNSANGLYGSSQVTFFTRYVPYGNDNGTWRVLSGTHGDGTVSATSGGSSISGIDTTFLEHAHRGAIVKIPAGAVGTFTGAANLFTESSVTGEWYMTDLDGNEVPIIGDEFYSLGTSYGSIGAGNYEYSIATIGSFAGKLKANIGDGDTLGFDTFYVKTDADGTGPQDLTGPTKQAYTVGSAINISGSNYKWVASGGGTNEYYYVTRAGGDTIFEDIQNYFTNHQYYIKNSNGTDLWRPSRAAAATVLTNGVVGSLNNLEIAIGDGETPALGFNTVYLRDDGGSPDTRGSVRVADGIGNINLRVDTSTSSYKWTQSSVDSTTYYLQLQANGNPYMFDPYSGLWTGTGYTQSVTKVYSLPTTLSRAYYYGDEDSLGYNTIYVKDVTGNPDLTGIAYVFYVRRSLYGSNYSWTASAGGTNEYFLEQQDGSELAADFIKPASVLVENFYVTGDIESGTSSSATIGTIGSLNDREWGFGKNVADSRTYDTVYLRWDDGDPDTENLKVIAQYSNILYASVYKWIESPATSDEWYLAASADDGDPSIGEPASLKVGGVAFSEGAVGSLAADEYDYGDNDSLGFSTIYIYSTTDPNGSAGTGVGDESPPVTVGSEASSDSFDYYVLDQIIDDEQAYIYGEIQTSVSGVTPTIYYNHNPFLANYKLNIQAYTAGLIYNGPTIRDNLSEEDICGPFYADLLKGTWGYSAEIFVDTRLEGTGVLFEKQPSLGYNNLVYVQIFPTVDDAVDTDQPLANFLATSSSLNANNSWSKKHFQAYTDDNGDSHVADVTIVGGTDMRLNSIQASGSTFTCAAQVFSGGNCYPGIAYSTTPFLGVTWQVRTITSIDGNSTAWADPTGATRASTDYQAVCAAWNGSSPGRIVCLVWVPNSIEIHQMYSDDSGATWTLAATITGTSENEFSKIRYLDGQFVFVSEYFVAYGDGSSNTYVNPDISDPDTATLRDIAFDGDERWVVISDNFKTWYADDLDGPWTKVELPFDTSQYGDETAHITWDSTGEKFVINSAMCFFSSDDGEEWASDYISSYGDPGSFKIPTNPVESTAGLAYNLYDGGANYLRTAALSRYNYTWWNVVDFVPLSDIYRSSTFSVLDGYVVLLGTREYEEILDDNDDGTGVYAWTYYPRRIRWTAPATYNDFTTTGSGTADANGEGAFLDSRPVNGRIVVFETNRVSAVVPRGDVDDPWDYDVVKEDFRILSNPVTVDDQAYVIATDGLLYATDGINLVETGSSFDATKFDDFTEDKPIILDYSRLLNSLLAYYFDPSVDNHYCYFISLSNGAVTKVNIPKQSSTYGALAVDPAFVTAVSDSSDQRIIFSYHPSSAVTDKVVTTTFSTGEQIKGRDIPFPGNASNDASYWYGILETGELYLAPEGQKTSLKHIIVRTYSEADGTNTDRPRIIAQIKSLEDSDWHVVAQDTSGSSVGITDDACFGNYTAWSNKVADGDDGTTVFTLPVGDSTPTYWVDGSFAQIYLEESGSYTLQTLGTDYTVPDANVPNEIEFVTAPTSSQAVYYAWNNKPSVLVSTGDFFLCADGYHRITAISNASTITLDHYAASSVSYDTAAGDQIDHYPSFQIPDGEGETKIGTNIMVDGFKLRLIIIPEYGATAAPKTVKVTGIVFGHVPQGRKILQATGS